VLGALNACDRSRTSSALLIEVVSFMHTGKLRPYDHDEPEHERTLKDYWEIIAT
jgi:hypothetical protein